MEPVNEADVEGTEYDRGDARFTRKQLGAVAGGERIGTSLYEQAPGDRAWPYHYHAGNEEALYVLAGEGQVRTDGDAVRVEAGDYLAFPEGPAGAHRVVNDGDDPLRYLAISTMEAPDVTVYPDSGKFGVFVGTPPGGPKGERDLHGFYRVEDDVDFWVGEPGADDDPEE
jgi:uncharacterized cupin superfamily protein